MKKQEATLRRLLLGDDGSAERKREQQRIAQQQKEIDQADDDAMMYLAREVSKQQLEQDQKRVSRIIEKEEKKKAKEARAAARAAAAAAAAPSQNAADHQNFSGDTDAALFEAQIEEAIAQSLLEANNVGSAGPHANGHSKQSSAQHFHPSTAPPMGDDEALNDPAVKAFIEKRRLRQQQQRDDELQRSLAEETQRQLQLAQMSRSSSGSHQVQDLHHGLTAADLQAFAIASDGRASSNAASSLPYRSASPASRHMSSAVVAPKAAPLPLPAPLMTEFSASAPMMRPASPASRFMSSAPHAPVGPVEFGGVTDQRGDFSRPAQLPRHPSPASRHMSTSSSTSAGSTPSPVVPFPVPITIPSAYSSPPSNFMTAPGPAVPPPKGEEYDPTHILHSDNQVAYKAAVALLQLARKSTKGMMESEASTRDSSSLQMASIWLTQASHYLSKQREAKATAAAAASSSAMLAPASLPMPAPMLSMEMRTNTPRLSDFQQLQRSDSHGRSGYATTPRAAPGIVPTMAPSPLPQSAQAPSPALGAGPMPVLIPMPSAAPAPSWECPVCTLVNKGTFLTCEACDMPKP